MSGELYLIRAVDSGPSDCAWWWGPKFNGYVRDLSKAGRYSLAEATAIHKSRSTDVPYRESEVMAQSFPVASEALPLPTGYSYEEIRKRARRDQP